jgi:anti-anti-sigma factor
MFMTTEQSEIALMTDDELSHALAVPLMEAEPVSRTLLESERFGLLAATKLHNKHRRMEDWIASNLDLGDDAPPVARSAWTRLIDGLPGLKRTPREKRRPNGVETSMLGWSRFHVAYKRGVTVVRLVDKNLAREAHVRELACDLLDLIEAGNHRVVLNFQLVERLASWVVVVVDEARRLCESADGGALKICGLGQQLALIFPIAGVAIGNVLHADEAAAIDSPWPEASRPRALPIEILSAIINGSDIRPIRGGAPAETAESSKPSAGRPKSTSTLTARPGLDGLWLNVQVGSAKGRSVAVTGSRFLIGRDQSCQLRLGSPMVSKLHAAIERRDESGIVLLDLGSTNGTLINGRLLRSKNAQLNEGDRIQIGPVVATLTVGPPKAETGKVDEMVAGWLNRDGSAGRSYSDDLQPTESFLMSDQAVSDPDRRVKHEVIQDVLVVTPVLTELDDDEAIELFRSLLHELYEQPTPRHVVVNLECVRHLSAQAIGVLLAHHLRLNRDGGALRICQAHARLMAVLHHVRLTILVECHPTLDEAVLAAWTGVGDRTTRTD